MSFFNKTKGTLNSCGNRRSTELTSFIQNPSPLIVAQLLPTVNPQMDDISNTPRNRTARGNKKNSSFLPVFVFSLLFS